MPTAKLGPFEVVRELGSGGMGVVYAVKEPLTGRTLALKLLQDEGRDSTALERFEREAEVLARVHHRSVVRVHKTGRLREGSYLLQALVEGESLKAVCARGPLPPRRAAELARELADALVVVHAAGVLHRDLKPANVILQPDGIPVLLDFGVARDQTAERLTRTGTLLGSASYMAPEQANGASPASLDGRTDVYGLGATLHELLTGEPPFSGTSLEVLQAVLGRDPPSPRSLRPEVPAALDAIVRRAMAKAAAARHPTMAALRDDLAGFLVGAQPVHVPRPPRAALLGLLGGAAALGLAAAGAVLLIARPPAPDVASPAPVTTAAPRIEPRSDPRPGPGAEPLWRLAAGVPVDLAFDYTEQDSLANLALGGVLRLTPGPATGQVAPVAIELTALRIGFGSAATGTGAPYDSARPQSDHPLAEIGKAVGPGLTCALHLGTGEVSGVAGADLLRRRVNARNLKALEMVDKRTVSTAVRGLLSDTFFERFLDGMLHVRTTTLPWSPGVGPGAFLLAGRTAQVVPSVVVPELKRDTPVRVSGETRYRDGRLVEATLVQVDERGDRGAGTARWVLRPAP